MFIVIEGLDGTGKTTLAKNLASALEGIALSTPSKKLNEARNIVDIQYKNNITSRQLFYASSVLSISSNIEDYLASGKTVVVDRYWLSTQVYHCWKSKGCHLSLCEVENLLVKPDYTVFLDLPLNIRESRVNFRNQSTDEDITTLSKDNDSTLRELYKSYEGTAIAGVWLEPNADQSQEELVKSIINSIS